MHCAKSARAWPQGPGRERHRRPCPNGVPRSLPFRAKNRMDRAELPGPGAQTEPPVAGWLCLRGDEPLERVEAVHPTVPVKRTTRLGLERALRKDNLRRFTEIPK